MIMECNRSVDDLFQLGERNAQTARPSAHHFPYNDVRHRVIGVQMGTLLNFRDLADQRAVM